MGRPKVKPQLLEARGAYRSNSNRAPKAGPVLKTVKASASVKDYAAIAEQYAEDVVSGKIVTGKYARLACQRHLDDLKASASPKYAYSFVPEKANGFCRLVERYPHIKGRWAAKNERIKLEPWQCFALCVPFGWVRREDGLRRFREIYLQVARKNAKSTLAAAIGNNMLLDDGEFGAEVYCGATSEKQAWEVFGPAKLMLSRTPELLSEYAVEVWARSLVKPEDNSRFWPIIGKPGDGSSPSCAIADEYHEHDTSDLVDTMVTGMGSREQPMLLIITTAGTNLAAPCYDKCREAQRVLDGKIKQDSLFALIYAIDEGDDWTDPAVLIKANPNMGVSVDEEFLITQQTQATSNPAIQNRFRTKHMNEWCGASVAGINMAAWRKAADPTLKISDFLGEEMFASLDLASKLDVCSYVRMFRREVAGLNHYYAFARSYLPSETVAEATANKQAYQKWVIEKRLILTEGAEIDFDQIREDVKADAALYQIREVVYDPWRATQLAQQLRNDGATTVEIGQTAKNMGEAFDELNSALKSGRLHHDGDPVLEWMAGNVVAKTVAKGLTVPSKDKPEHKIDGIVAIVMAVARAMQTEPIGIAGWLDSPVMT